MFFILLIFLFYFWDLYLCQPLGIAVKWNWGKNSWPTKEGQNRIKLEEFSVFFKRKSFNCSSRSSFCGRSGILPAAAHQKFLTTKGATHCQLFPIAVGESLSGRLNVWRAVAFLTYHEVRWLQNVQGLPTSRWLRGVIQHVSHCHRTLSCGCICFKY